MLSLHLANVYLYLIHDNVRVCTVRKTNGDLFEVVRGWWAIGMVGHGLHAQ